MPIVEALLALIAACVGFALLARRLRMPYAVVLVLGGMAIAFIPNVPAVTLDPAIALTFFLPPLLQGSAYRTDWRAFRSFLRPILMLAVGYVVFTAFAIGCVAKLLVPEMPWAAAITLGAIVAPPDAVAAAAVMKGLRIPRRITVVLEGESLLNDASALVLYRFAIAAVGAAAVAPHIAAATFLLLAAGGVAAGWVVGRATIWALRRLNDTMLETVLSFLAGFAAFFLAEALHASGVIAVVTTGILLGVTQHRVISARTRQESRAVWEFVEFVLNSLVFILIGLQLNGILQRLSGWDSWQLLGIAVALSSALIVMRFVWVFPGALLPRLIPAIRRSETRPPNSWIVVVCWAGMRGVVSLAAALALPADFPQRDLIIFLAFCAILATLVLQGTTLAPLIRWLRIEERGADGMHPREAEARRLVAKATLVHLRVRAEDPLEGAIARDLLQEYEDKARVYDGISKGASAAELTARLQLRLAALRAGRERLLLHHREDGLEGELLMGIEQELDLEELRLRRLLGADA